MPSPTGTQAVDRAAQLLIAVARHRDPVSFTELTAASGLAKSTTSRLLMALERNGLVRRDDTGKFSPGEVFLSYAWRGGAEADLVSVTQPVLTQLGEQTGETVNLGVPRDGGFVDQQSRYRRQIISERRESLVVKAFGCLAESLQQIPERRPACRTHVRLNGVLDVGLGGRHCVEVV